MQLFPTNPELEGVDNVSACYGGTQALLNTLNWLRAGVSSKRYGIVVATDTACALAAFREQGAQHADWPFERGAYPIALSVPKSAACRTSNAHLR